jgi:hydroxymethylglutaryl-CoA lyase
MTSEVELMEVGPRDGLQLESVVISTDDKIELISRLIDAGVKRIEATSFVNPKKVPQMADAESLLARVPRIPGVIYTGLILNRKGLDRAIAAGCDEIGMVVVASDTFNRRNQGVSTEESIAAWLEIAGAARAAGVRAQVTVSAAFGCPFEGEVALPRVVDIALRVAEAEPHEICFADTIGVGVPTQVERLLAQVQHELPAQRLRCHFHNTRNTGIANAMAAVKAGVAALDASIGGIGGCPFAPAATGNIASEDLLYLLNRSGVRTGVSLEKMIATASWLGSKLGRAVPGMLTKAGPFPSARAVA